MQLSITCLAKSSLQEDTLSDDTYSNKRIQTKKRRVGKISARPFLYSCRTRLQRISTDSSTSLTKGGELGVREIELSFFEERQVGSNFFKHLRHVSLDVVGRLELESVLKNLGHFLLVQSRHELFDRRNKSGAHTEIA